MRVHTTKKFGQCVFRVKINTVGQFVRAWDISSVTYSLHSASVGYKVGTASKETERVLQVVCVFSLCFDKSCEDGGGKIFYGMEVAG
jgi:hypothetical protein